MVHAAAREGRDLAAELRTSARVVQVGVGPARAALHLTVALQQAPRPDVVVAFGVCGAYPARCVVAGAPCLDAIGQVCVVTRDAIADEGVATETGFLDLPALGLAHDTVFAADAPLTARLAAALRVPVVAGATVSTCSGTDARAREVAARSGAAVETMEGAALALVCAHFGVPFVQLRAVSNWCGDRARAQWDLAGALAALHAALPRALAAL
jgi:futalosine hydrolase